MSLIDRVRAWWDNDSAQSEAEAWRLLALLRPRLEAQYRVMHAGERAA